VQWVHLPHHAPAAVLCEGGMASISASMVDYGTSYTPDLTGTTEAIPDSYLVPEAQAGEDCVPPPWWSPPESSYH
jgi:hypothetical protein